MKIAVMYGAGNIGRGFIGQLLSLSGYQVVFVDLNEALVARLNADRLYPIRFVSNAGAREVQVENVRAVHALDHAGVASVIAEASVMATAVGAPALRSIAASIAAGLSRRWSDGNLAPLNILICENLPGAGGYLQNLVVAALDESERAWLDERVGFVETSIGRMVPVMSPEMQEGNPLRIWVEDYAELPVDRNGFRGAIPDIRNMVPHHQFRFHIHRKLYVHNMGHAVTAYLGQQRGHRYVAQAVADPDILATCRAAMMESAQALAREHDVALAELAAHVENLLDRFGNHALGDTLDRVGRDLQRKLAPNDRLIGALGACIRNGVEPLAICSGVAAALRFRDPVAGPVSILLRARGPEAVLEDVCGMARGSWAWERVLEAYHSASPLASTL